MSRELRTWSIAVVLAALTSGCANVSASFETYGTPAPGAVEDTSADITVAEGECASYTFQTISTTTDPVDDTKSEESAASTVTIDDPSIVDLLRSTREWQAGGYGDTGEQEYAPGDGSVGPVFVVCGKNTGKTSVHVHDGGDDVGAFVVEVVGQLQ